MKTEISWPQVSGGCPYKVVISQWVPTRPEANELNEHYSNVTLTQTQRMVLYPFSQGATPFWIQSEQLISKWAKLTTFKSAL